MGAKAKEAKEIFSEIVMHCECSETPPEHENTASYICSEAKNKGLAAYVDGALASLGVPTVVVKTRDGDRDLVAIDDGGWSVDFR